MTTNPNAEHRASVSLAIEVYQTNSGKPVTAARLNECGIRSKSLLTITGDTEEQCLRKLRLAIERFNSVQQLDVSLW